MRPARTSHTVRIYNKKTKNVICGVSSGPEGPLERLPLVSTWALGGVYLGGRKRGRGAFSYDRFSCIFKLQVSQIDMIRSIDFNQLDSIFPISILAQNMNYQINCFHLGPKMCELARSANAGNLSFALCGQLCDAVPLSKWHKLFTVISSEKKE